MKQWLATVSDSFAETIGRGLALLVLGLLGAGAVAGVVVLWGPEVASRFSSSLP